MPLSEVTGFCLPPLRLLGGKTRKITIGGSLSAVKPIYMGLLPHTPPKETFCKKSPLESRKTAFDFYCLGFHRLLSRYQKTGAHVAYSPSASQCACSAHREFNPQNRHRRFASCLFSMKRVSPTKASLRLQATIRLAFALKVSKITVHAAYSPSASRCA